MGTACEQTAEHHSGDSCEKDFFHFDQKDIS
jgi:hypothetical protein